MCQRRLARELMRRRSSGGRISPFAPTLKMSDSASLPKRFGVGGEQWVPHVLAGRPSPGSYWDCAAVAGSTCRTATTPRKPCSLTESGMTVSAIAFLTATSAATSRAA